MAQSTRRSFLKRTSAAVAAGLTLPHIGQGRAYATPVAPARNLIFLVADGMNVGTLALANHWLYATEGRDTRWVQLYNDRPVSRALQETRSADAIVPDSAAAGSTWGIGERVNNRALNTTPDGRQPTPIWVRAKEHGKATGLVTTARMSHATPAAFAANAEHRRFENDIAEQYLRREIDLLLGGGSRHFDPERRDDELNLFGRYERAGYSVVRDRDGLLAAPKNTRLLGSFYSDHLPYDLDRKNSPELTKTIPTLAEMTRAALDRLPHNKEGFVLQIEGARVDHAGHANDPAAILHDQLAFDEAIAVAVDWADRNPDTLVIVTTDHGTGGCMLNGAGPDYRGADALLANLGAIRHSYEYASEQIIDGRNWQDVITETLELPITPEMREKIPAMAAEAQETGHMRHLYPMSSILADEFEKRTAVGWTSSNHTADLVEVLAFGPGSELLAPYIKNTEVFDLMVRAVGI